MTVQNGKSPPGSGNVVHDPASNALVVLYAAVTLFAPQVVSFNGGAK